MGCANANMFDGDAVTESAAHALLIIILYLLVRPVGTDS